MSSGLSRGERATVHIKDDEELDWEDVDDEHVEEVEVFDHVTVVQESYINSRNGHETFTGKIARGDDSSLPEPDAITERVAEVLWHEFGVDVESDGFDIRVVNIDDPNVWVA